MYLLKNNQISEKLSTQFQKAAYKTISDLFSPALVNPFWGSQESTRN